MTLIKIFDGLIRMKNQSGESDYEGSLSLLFLFAFDENAGMFDKNAHKISE